VLISRLDPDAPLAQSSLCLHSVDEAFDERLMQVISAVCLVRFREGVIRLIRLWMMMRVDLLILAIEMIRIV